LRYVGTSKDIRFEYYDDLTALPALMIREDSWFDAAMDGFVFTPALTVTNGATLTIEDGITLTFDEDLIVEAGARLDVGAGATLQFAPGKRIVNTGDFDADGATFTASNASQGWGGIRYEQGSTGTLDGATVERVRGPNGYDGTSIYVDRASPQITGSTIRNSANYGNGAAGIYITGQQAPNVYPTITGIFVQQINGDGIVLNNGAYAVLTNNTVQNNVDDGIVIGPNSDVFLKTNSVTANDVGVFAANGGYAGFGDYYYLGDGFNVINGNTGRGVYAFNNAQISAGNSSRHRYSSFLGNDVRAQKSNARVYASADYWGDENDDDVGDLPRTSQSQTGQVFASTYCTDVPNAQGCTLDTVTSSSRMASGSGAVTDATPLPYRLDAAHEAAAAGRYTESLDHLKALAEEGDGPTAYAEAVRLYAASEDRAVLTFLEDAFADEGAQRTER
ncbi:MAG: right-handed parallel beta-helix repeat-containing protein, partial [Bacteroidota bacterium]